MIRGESIGWVGGAHQRGPGGRCKIWGGVDSPDGVAECLRIVDETDPNGPVRMPCRSDDAGGVCAERVGAGGEFEAERAATSIPVGVPERGKVRVFMKFRCTDVDCGAGDAR